MNYFDNLFFRFYDYLPHCASRVDRSFDYYALNFCRSGAIFWAKDEEPPIHLSGPVAWWTLGESRLHATPRYHYGALENEDWEHFYVSFSGPRLEAMVQSGLIPCAPGEPHFRAVADSDSYARAFWALFETLDREGLQSPLAVHRLEGLFLALQTQTPPSSQLSPLEIEVQAWLEAIRATPQAPWDIKRQAQTLAVSVAYFRRLATRLAGVPPHRFILERRLDLAASKLRASNQPIKTIVPDCGFEDLPHFTRLFTRRFQISPAAYRREAPLIT